MTETVDHYQDRDLPNPKHIQQKLTEARAKLASLPEGRKSRDERQRLNRAIRSMEETLERYGES